MKSKTGLIAVIVPLTFTACSSVNYGDSAKVDEFSTPSLEQIVEVYVGEAMLTYDQSTTNEYLVLNKAINGVSYQLPEGAYVRVGEYKGASYYSPITDGGEAIGYIQDWYQPAKALHVEADKVCVTTVRHQSVQCYDGEFAIEDRVVSEEPLLRQTLTYNGFSGDTLNISYREFVEGDVNRALTNSVEYDMSQSNTIYYKGAQINVLEFDNQSIQFEVIKHFDGALEPVQ